MPKICHNKTFSKETEAHLMEVTKIPLKLASLRNQTQDPQGQALTTVNLPDPPELTSLYPTPRKVATAPLLKQISTNLTMNSSAVSQI